MYPILQNSKLRFLCYGFLLIALMSPRAVGHAHASMPCDTLAATQLAEHLQKHHSDSRTTTNCPNTWHMHWVFPESGYRGLNTDCLATTFAPPVVSDLPTTLSSSGSIAWLKILDCVRLTPACNHLLNQTSPAVLNHFYRQDSLLEQFGVMNC